MSAPTIELARLLNEARRRLTDRLENCEFPRCRRCKSDEVFLQECRQALGPILPEGMRADPATAIIKSTKKG
jgi:hypothetical protein